MQKIKKAVIPAAGFGTRFLPATKAMPKEMLPILDKPTIQYIVEEALASGIEDILIISGHTKRAIEDHFDMAPVLTAELKRTGKFDLLLKVEETANVNVHYVRQKSMKGLGDAILCAETFMHDEPFAVLLGDDVVYSPKRPALLQLMEQYEKTGSSVLGCQMVKEEKVSSYGIVLGEEVEKNLLWQVHDMVEKPARGEVDSRLAVLGRYILKPHIFDILKKTKPGKNGEVQLTDAIKKLATEDDVYACAFTGRRYDLGDKLGFLEAQVEFALRREDLREDFARYLEDVLKRI